MTLEVRMSTSHGKPYYHDTETGKSTWEPPAGLTQEQINSLPGAAEYLNSNALGGGAKSDQIRASHILVKHKDSRRPSSWKEPQITRSKEEAIAILKGYQAEINGSPEKFGAIASAHSDCASHAKNGDLGFFGRGQMQAPFEHGAYALQVGEMSDIVSTDSGVHLILRTA